MTRRDPLTALSPGVHEVQLGSSVVRYEVPEYELIEVTREDGTKVLRPVRGRITAQVLPKEAE